MSIIHYIDRALRLRLERVGWEPKRDSQRKECQHCAKAIPPGEEHWHNRIKHRRIHAGCLDAFFALNRELASDGWAQSWKDSLAEIEQLKDRLRVRGYLVLLLEERLGRLCRAAEWVLTGQDPMPEKSRATWAEGYPETGMDALREALHEARKPRGAHPERMAQTLAECEVQGDGEQ